MKTNSNNGSSWGNPSNEIDIKAIRKFNSFLRGFNSCLEMAHVILAASILLSLILIFINADFIDLITNDGTNSMCIINGKTGEINYVFQN
ncbi:hypothetical protein SJI19_17000 [Acerihabitans sp. TG2]|uniref:hypothetical protein n=1 Tax=Acerihabitans sp. TG2 TaxID=3096008 RepID=UPI002B22B4E1|nr:hypothetical protein [Acerihabitans sp. TG2]MEA9392225.1 hypothetical protein [Acerihabitans sp. TG2]